MHSIRAFVALGAVFLVPSTPVAAQSAQKFSLQVSGLYIKFDGSAYGDMSSGSGGEAQIRYTAGSVSLGIGYQYTRHTMIGEEGTMSTAGMFMEPRYVFTISKPNFAPYISARLSLLQMQGIMPDNSSGGNINLGGGVLTRVSSRVNFDLGGTVGVSNFAGGFDGSGSDFVLRAGVAIGLGG
jgi:hypothetical protein